uniref:tRNA (cytosine(38)-C(5))-methyltransferase n=1 Tax=Timema shepardi TaxID=629360 RepID=A0A7R9AVJ4_TIMSH|nr:unnamed protein product [Timema shepardi]
MPKVPSTNSVSVESGVDVEVVAAADINTLANHVYRHNFPGTRLIQRNIQSLTVQEVDDMTVEMIVMSPPCQPFTSWESNLGQQLGAPTWCYTSRGPSARLANAHPTLAWRLLKCYRVGLKKDVSDVRTCSLLHVLALLPDLKDSFRYLLVENVRGFESSQARDHLVSTLDSIDFSYQEFMLSPSQFSIPNTRHRYYLVAKRRPLAFCFENTRSLVNIRTSLLYRSVFLVLFQSTELPFSLRGSSSESESVSNLLSTLNLKHRSLVDRHNTDESQCYPVDQILETGQSEEHMAQFLVPDKVLGKHVKLLDIVEPSSTRSCCFTKAYTHYVEGTGSVLSPAGADAAGRELERVGAIEPGSEQQVGRLRTLQLRYFTDREIARLMGFPEVFTFPQDVTRKQKYRLLGNSVNVHVVALLILLLVSEAER